MFKGFRSKVQWALLSCFLCLGVNNAQAAEQGLRKHAAVSLTDRCKCHKKRDRNRNHRRHNRHRDNRREHNRHRHH